LVSTKKPERSKYRRGGKKKRKIQEDYLMTTRWKKKVFLPVGGGKHWTDSIVLSIINFSPVRGKRGLPERLQKKNDRFQLRLLGEGKYGKEKILERK